MEFRGEKLTTCLQSLSHVPPRDQHRVLQIQGYLLELSQIIGIYKHKDLLLSENLEQNCMTSTEDTLYKTLTIQFADEKLSMTAFTAKITVVRCFGRR